MAAAERLITEVTAIKQGLQTAIADQAAQSQKAIEETHTAYESTISVLHATIARMQKSLTSNFHGPEILQLSKDIHKLLFNSAIPNNSQLAESMKAHFAEVCTKVDGLKQWLEEAPGLHSSRAGSDREDDRGERSNTSIRQSPPITTNKIPTPQPSPPPSQNIPSPHSSPKNNINRPLTPPHLKNLEE